MLDVLLAAVLVKLINISSDETLKYNAIGCLQLISTDEDGCRQIAKAKAQPQVMLCALSDSGANWLPCEAVGS